MPDQNPGPKSRTRELPGKSGTAHAKSVNNNVVFGTPSTTVVYDSSASWSISGRQQTVSEGHPFASRKRGIGDIGGPFFTQKSYFQGGISNHGGSYGYWVAGGPETDPRAFNLKTYSGPRLAKGPDANGNWPWPTPGRSSEDDLDEAGATAIANCRPDNSIASLSTALGEIYADGLPHLLGSTFWRERTLNARNAGKEYLNTQFGWVPFVNDVMDFRNAVRNFSAVLAQYERDAGRMVRRRYDFPRETSTTESVFTGSVPWEPVSSNLRSSTGTLVVRDTVTKKKWFSGAFVYHLPRGYDSRSEMDRLRLFADRIGLDTSPETFWNLAPWSWAVDWFSNAGDVISNVSSFTVDGQVMAYGYMMEHTVHRVTYSMEDVRSVSGGYLPVDPITLVTETKVRRRANPYGFGVSWDGLSPFQISILTALGLSRS